MNLRRTGRVVPADVVPGVLARELRERAAHEGGAGYGCGCWEQDQRLHLCAYHEGWLDGLVSLVGQVERVAGELAEAHWDGTGCGDAGRNACSYCYGPSPMSAGEVARFVYLSLLSA